MDADFSFMAVNIQQNLRRFADPGHGFERVAASQNGEIRDRIEFKQIGAGDDEEVADHQVRRPGLEQIGQAVKNVKDNFTKEIMCAKTIKVYEELMASDKPND